MSLPQTATSSRHQTTHSNPIFPKAGADPLNSILVATNSFLGSVSAENKFNVAYQTSVLSDHILASILLSDGSRGLDFQQILTPLLTSMGIPPGQVNQAFLKTFSDHLEDYRRDLLKKQEIIRLQKQVRQTIGDNKVTPREYIKHLNEQGSSVQEQFTNALSSSTASSADLPPVFDQTPSFTQEAWTTTPTPTLTSEPSTSYFSPSVSDQESRSDQSSFSPPSINQIKNAAEFLKNPSLTNAFKSFGKGGLSQALKGASQLGKAGLQAGKAALTAGKAAAVGASAGLVAALPYIAAGIAVTVVLAVIIAIFVPEVSKWFAVDPSDIAAMQADSISGQEGDSPLYGCDPNQQSCPAASCVGECKWPVECGCITQGPLGTSSHFQNKLNAIDIMLGGCKAEGTLGIYYNLPYPGTITKIIDTYSNDQEEGTSGNYGNTIEITVNDPTGAYTVKYAHFYQGTITGNPASLSVGSTIESGTLIGIADSSGMGGYHLHYEVRGTSNSIRAILPINPGQIPDMCDSFDSCGGICL